MRFRINTRGSLGLVALAAFLTLSMAASSAAQAQPAAAQRPLGTITAIQGNTITMKTDAGAMVTVQVQDSAKLARIEPGQKDLKGAEAVQLQDLQTGDRILARGTLGDDGKTVQASVIILMKAGDIQKKQQQEQDDWRRRGTGGLVKSIDPATGTITISTGAGPTAKTVAVVTSKDTVLKRYASNSVKFSDAKSGTLDEIKPGDQLRALGNKNADGTQYTAEQVVSGSFRNIAGTVSAVDAASGQVTVMDLIAKKPVVVKVTADSQLHSIPPNFAQMIAMRLKGGAAAGPGGAPGAPGAGGAAATAGAAQAAAATGNAQGAAGGSVQSADAGAVHSDGQRQWAGAGGGAGGAGFRAGGAGGAPDFQQMLSRMPATKLEDLQKGSAVMIVSSEGTSEVTAITLLSGVEAILTAAPGAGQAAQAAQLMSGWSLGGGGGGGDAGGGDAGGGGGPGAK